MNAPWSISMVAAGAVILLGGCGRTPPHSVKSAATNDQAPADGTGRPAEAPRPLPEDDLLVSIRDGQVERATFVAPVPIPKSEQQLAADALSRIGPPAVPMLVEALRSSDREVRRQSCEVLLRMGPDAKEAVPELIRLLDDEDEELRRMAAKALGRIGPDAADAVPALMRTMLPEEAAEPLSERAAP